MKKQYEKKDEIDPRKNFFIQYTEKFAQAFNMAMEGFSTEERINLIGSLLAILECYREKPTNYFKAQKINDELFAKYRKKLINYSNLNLSEYFAEQSMEQVDLQYQLKMDKVGHYANFLTEGERLNFLHWVEKHMIEFRQKLYLTLEPEIREPDTEVKSEEGVLKGRFKGFRDRNDNITRLSLKHTAILIYCLQETKAILNKAYIDDKKIGMAFSILTGFSADTLRQNLNKLKLTEIANSRKNVETVEKLLKDMIEFIKNNIKPERPFLREPSRTQTNREQ